MYETCSNHSRAFVEYGIHDGADIVHRTYYRLVRNGDRRPAASSEFVDRLASAFRTAFVRGADTPLVPESIEAAIEEASGTIAHRLLDDPDADLRTDVVPAFYRAVARAYCAHPPADPETDVGIWFESDDDDGGIRAT